MRTTNDATCKLINEIKDLLKDLVACYRLSARKDIRRVMIYFLTKILEDFEEKKSRGLEYDLKMAKIDDLEDLNDYYLHHIFSRYYLDRFLHTKNSSYILKKVADAVMHFNALKDYSTPLNVIGTIAMRLIRRGEIKNSLYLIDMLSAMPIRGRDLVIAEIYGEISLELLKKGFIDRGVSLLFDSVKMLNRMGYDTNSLWLIGRAIKLICEREKTEVIMRILNISAKFFPLFTYSYALKYGSKDLKNQIKPIFMHLLSEYIRNGQKNKELVEAIILSLPRLIEDKELMTFVQKAEEALTSKGERGYALIISCEREVLEFLKYGGKKRISRILELVNEMDKLGMSKFAADCLRKILDALDVKKMLKNVTILSEIIAYLYEKSGDYEKIFEIFGEIAAKLIKNDLYDEAFTFIKNAGTYSSVSRFIMIKLLIEPIARELVRKRGREGAEMLLAKIRNFIRESSEYISAYLLSIIIEELIKRGDVSHADDFSRILFSFPHSSNYFHTIISLLLKKGDLERVYGILNVLSRDYEKDTDLITNAIFAMISENYVKEALKLLNKYREYFSSEKFAKLLSDISIRLAEKKYYRLATNLALQAIDQLLKEKAYLTALNTVAFVIARMDDINAVVSFIRGILNSILECKGGA